MRLIAVVLGVAVLGGPQPAAADYGGWGSFRDNPPGIGGRIWRDDPGGPAGGIKGGSTPLPDGSYLVYEPMPALDPFTCAKDPFFGPACVPCPEGLERYIQWTIVVRDGVVVDRRDPRIACFPPPPPPPPTTADVRRFVPLPDPVVRVNPRVRGLAGLQSWLWYEGDRKVSLDLSLGGYSVHVEAEAVRFTWFMGDGGRVSADEPGSEAAPAATYVYRHRSGGRPYTITLQVTWRGWYTFTYPGGETSPPIRLGFLTVAGARPYDVAEVQAVAG